MPHWDRRLGATSLFSDDVLSRLEPLIGKAAKAIRDAVSSSRPIVLRYNNDADGICGGLSIYRAIMKLKPGYPLLREFQNNSAIYDFGDASGDLLLLRGISESRPLAILVDFGANVESIEALKTVHAEGVEVIVIDHHPPCADALKLIDLFVSPWAVLGGTSHYCAGLIAGEVAKRMADVEVDGLQRIALAGDRSMLQPFSEELRRKALALDYLADTTKPRNTLAKCELAVTDAGKLVETYRQAARKLADALGEAKEKTKRMELENGFLIVITDVVKNVERGTFPPKGKVVGALHDELAANEARPLVTIGKGRDSLTFRANAAAKKAGFNASKIIDGLKEELPNAILSGGGHDAAASLRADKGFGRIVLDEALKKIAQIGGR